MSEKSFQSYVMKLLPHGYRTSLVNGSGFPDILAINGKEHFLIELKLLHIGSSGNKKLKSTFQPTQVPWYFNYLKKGGDNLFVLFKLDDKYGVLRVTEEFCRNFSTITYLDMAKSYNYSEWLTLKELVEVNFV